MVTKFRQLLEIESLEGYTEKEALEVLSKLIDYSYRLNSTLGTDKALELGEKLDKESVFKSQHSLFYYYMSIAWSDKRSLSKGKVEAWEWNHREVENEIVNLRRALSYFNADEIVSPVDRYCQIYTNLGNSLDFCGRFVAAMDCWNNAIERDPGFGMALGAKGNSLVYHAKNSLYDEGHQKIFLAQGFSYLKNALERPLEPYAKEAYQNMVLKLGELNPWVVNAQFDLDRSNECGSDDEKGYRDWCLKNALFLNPLNDIGYFQIASHDPFALPNMIVSREYAGSFHSFFNQIKQEFISARLLLFEGKYTTSEHFADRGVLRYDLMDFAENSIGVERIKASYKTAYSIFDKVSFFLNSYLDLNIPEHQIDFRTIWYKKRNSAELRDVFERKSNLMFRALYWLHKDLHYKEEGYYEALEPESKELAVIRNFIEHKGLRVYRDNEYLDITPELLKDRISYSISYDDLYHKTLRLIRLSREAIIYLSLGVRWEERAKESGDDFPSVTLSTQH